MKTIVFDVMCGDRFVMQYPYKWCPAFPIDKEKIVEEIITKRPTLRGKRIELYQTEAVLLRH